MDINQNQQVNTFTKGMNTDTSDALISNELYRYAENVRPITDTDSNSGELHLIEGTKGYDVQFPITWKGLQILAFDSIRDVEIYIIYKDGEWGIWKHISKTTNGKMIFGPCKERIWPIDDKGNPILNKKTITTVLRWESDKNIKLYMSDGIHPILSINVWKDDYGTNFDEVFAYQTVALSPLETSISQSTGYITAGVVLYAYRLYSQNGAASKVSPLSKPLSLYKSNVEGYAAKSKTGRAVHIKYPSIKNTLLDYILIYRINFVESGQQPAIALIRDEKITSQETIDTGVGDVSELSLAEFLSMFDADIVPTVIESKNDYLFAGNINYAQDNSDDEFVNFDARSYSKGNYVGENTGKDIHITDEQFTQNILRHKAFTDSTGSSINLDGTYDELLWEAVDGWNGIGKNIKWKYKYSDYYEITTDKLADTIYDSHRSFHRGEVYRFGIRLFNKKGIPTTVKWIADIMMPPLTIANDSVSNADMYIDQTDNSIRVRDLGIEFNVDLSDVKNICSGYEIVRCNRSIVDKYTITQGITGFPLELKNVDSSDDWTIYDGGKDDYGNTVGIGEEDQKASYLVSQADKLSFKTTNLMCPSGFMSQNKYKLYTGALGYKNGNLCWAFYNKKAEHNPNVLMFASPEYSYQPDDVKQLLEEYRDFLSVLPIVAYITNSTTRIGGKAHSFHATKEMTDDSLFVLSKLSGHSGMAYALKVYNDMYLHLPYVFLTNSDWNADDYANENPNFRDGGVYELQDTSKSDVFFNYITPNKVQTTSFLDRRDSVTDISFIKSPQYSLFADTENFKFLDNVVTIKDKQFINWSAPLLLDLSGDDKLKVKDLFRSTNGHWIGGSGNVDGWGPRVKSRTLYPIGAGGSCVLLNLEKERSTYFIPSQGGDNAFNSTPMMPQIIIENLRKSATPYSGYSYSAFARSTYYSYGDYLTSNNSTVTIFSGDSRIRMFTYNAVHTWYNSLFWQYPKMASVYAVPVECDVDIQGQFGILYNVNTNDYHVLDKASAFGTYNQEKDAYLYNTAYNIELDAVSHTSDIKTEAETNNFDTRIQYSELKTNNENVDSWLQFKALNFLDVDSRFGQLTDLKLFKDKLIFWQNNATGVLSVNERTVLQDVNDTLIVLGSGSTLERYDYFTTVYGQKQNQHVRAISNDFLYWWDGHNKEILLYKGGVEVAPLSTIKAIKNYINERKEVEMPSLIYDPKFKEIICSVVHKDSEESVVYNEQMLVFTSIYTFSPIFYAAVNDELYITNKSKVFVYNKAADEGKSKLFGMPAMPLIQYVVNANSTTPKAFDIQTFGGRFYGGDDLSNITFRYNTPLKQHSETKGIVGKNITNREYDFRLNIPRNTNTTIKLWGDRMRGKTMQCEFKSESNDRDFSLQYIITKFRMSWT